MVSFCKRTEERNIIEEFCGMKHYYIYQETNIFHYNSVTWIFSSLHYRNMKYDRNLYDSFPHLSHIESTNRRLVFVYRHSMRMSLLTLYGRKIGASSSRNSRGGVSSNRILRSRSPEKWVEIRWSTKKYIAWMLPRRSRRRAPERPWDRRRPSRTIYKPAVPTSSPVPSLPSSPGSLFAALSSRFFTPRLILRMNLRENFFRILPTARRLDAERNCGGKRGEARATSSYRDWILFPHRAFY